jgi:Fanconi anemia group M protein
MLTSTLLKEQIQPRRYQETIYAKAVAANTLVVLPTGLGKTMIAVMLAIQRLEQYGSMLPGASSGAGDDSAREARAEAKRGKVLILAPTKPLAQQHETTFRRYISMPEERFALFTGAIGPSKRQALWENTSIIFATPQGIENDLLGGKIKLDDVCLLVVDEAHRAVGDYAYVYLAKQYMKQAKNPRILALTASPGTDQESITEVCKNLAIEEIEVRSQEDPDVSPYVQEIDITWVKVDLPEEFKEIQKLLKDCYAKRLEHLQEIGMLRIPMANVNKVTLLAMQGELQGMMARGDRAMETMKALSITAEALKITHAIDLLETQGLAALQKYFQSLQEAARNGQSKAVMNVVTDLQWKAAEIKVDSLVERKIEHPKLKALAKIVIEHSHAQKDVKIIIFNQYRDQAVKIRETLEKLGVSSKIFVGQAKKNDTGMSQKEQKQILAEFAGGGFTCLIATSVAEEGLDIPKVDLVVFYEPVPSAIRTVQRRGRTGRGEKGEVIVLMAQGTHDVGSKWVAHHKEKRMYRAIIEVKKNFKMQMTPAENKQQKTLLQSYFDEKKQKAQEEAAALRIIGDYREKASPVMKELVERGVQLELKQLSIGDYQVSDRVVIEYKQVPDFVDSMLDGRLLSQLKELKAYPRPLIIVEGDQDMYALRKVHPNAIQGMLATIAVSYNIPILWSKTPRETAGLLMAIAKREQVGGAEFQYHTGKPLTDDELQEFIVAAFPGIGSQLAKPLLSEFKSIKNIVNATEDELKKVPLIGEKKAARIKELSERSYSKGNTDKHG